MQKLFKIIFSKKFLWRGREQLESPAHIFWQPAEFFPLDFQKITVCKVSNRISPEKFPWNWESSLTTSLVFSENWSKISLSVHKGKKNSEQSCYSSECFMGHLECSSNIPVEKLDKKPTNSCSLFKNDEKFHSFFKTVFSSKRFYRYKEWSFDRPAKIFLAQLLEMIRKKSPQNLHKLFKKIFFKMFLLRGRKQLESPDDFFSTSSRTFSARYSKNINL